MSFLRRDLLNGKLVEIRRDVFDIADRFKGIDSRLKVFFNREKNRFEVYMGDERRAVLPFEELDGRSLTYFLQTSPENAENLIGEIDRSNERLAENRREAARDEREYKLKNLVSYLENGGAEVPLYDEL